MNFSNEELDLFRQWFNALEDVSPKFLDQKDYELAKKVLDKMGVSPSKHMLEKLKKFTT